MASTQGFRCKFDLFLETDGSSVDSIVNGSQKIKKLIDHIESEGFEIMKRNDPQFQRRRIEDTGGGETESEDAGEATRIPEFLSRSAG